MEVDTQSPYQQTSKPASPERSSRRSSLAGVVAAHRFLPPLTCSRFPRHQKKNLARVRGNRHRPAVNWAWCTERYECRFGGTCAQAAELCVRHEACTTEPVRPSEFGGCARGHPRGECGCGRRTVVGQRETRSCDASLYEHADDCWRLHASPLGIFRRLATWPSPSGHRNFRVACQYACRPVAA